VDPVSQDFASIMTGEAAPKPTRRAAAPAAPRKTYDPVDAAIRTVYAENPNASDEELRAIASVIRNRAIQRGMDVGAVVQEDGQFEPWADDKGRSRIDRLDAKSPQYARLSALVGPILAGEAEPTVPYTHFYAPEAQKKLGRKPPEWDDGKGTQIGAHMFFAPGKENLGELLGADAQAQASAEAAYKETFGDPAAMEPGATLTGEGLVEFAPGKGAKPSETLTKPQREMWEALNKGGGMKEDAAGGDAYKPFFMQEGFRAKDVPPGAYYVDRAGNFHRAPGGEGPGSDPSFLRGLAQGGADVALSMANMAPGTDDSTIRNRMFTDQAVYDADQGGTFVGGAGRFLGQTGATIPLLLGGEAAAAPLLGRTALGRMFLGTAGAEALPAGASLGARVGQMGVRGASLGVSGAAEGAGAAALTHSASDAPFGQQVMTGALLGGALKPVAAGAEMGMRRFFGPSTQGAIPASEQQRLYEAAQSLPAPVALDAGQMSRAPAASAAVDDMLRGSEGDLAAGVVQRFRGTQQQALRDNVKAISDSIAGREIKPGEGATAVSDTLNAAKDKAKKAVDRLYDTARAKGEDAMLPTAQGLRDGLLDGLKRKYTESKIGSVLSEVESLGAEGAPTARQLFEARERLSGLTRSTDPVEAGAARSARDGFDAYMKTALKDDLFLGDPKAIEAWRKAIKGRAELGRLFEGDDLIEGLTESTQRGGGKALKVDPEEAANYVLGLSDLGFATKRDLTRDLFRLRDVLGKDSEGWNGMRAEVFMRLARAGEGAPEAGAAQFSGQKFLKAWNTLQDKNPRLVQGMFTQEERDLITKFADVAQAATTTVKGGANTSNSAIAAKRMMDRLTNMLSVGGGAGGGAVVGGVPGAAVGALFGGLLKDMREVLAVGKARKLTERARPPRNDPGLDNKLIGSPTAVTGATVTGNRILGERSEPEAR
jgi:hypothetical protein